MTRKILLTTGLLCAFVSTDLNAQIRIRNLPACPSVVSGDMLASAAVSGTTCKYTVGQLLTGYVPTTRTITCTAPLLCGSGSSHDLTSDFTISISGGGSGEVNTASNVGASGVGTYDSKSGVDLRFRKINGASSKLTATLNSQQIDLDVPDASTSQKGAVQLAGIDGTDVTAGKAVQASDVRLSDVRTPTSHVHNASDVNAGTLAAARLPTATTSAQGAAILATPSSDVTAGHVVQANDARLSDSRAPSGAAGGDLGGIYPNPTISARTVTQGGTGATTLTAHGVVIGNGTSAVNVTGAGTAGQILTSTGASSDPTFQSPTATITSAYKSSTQSIALSTTLTEDSQLSITLTSGTYKTEFLLWIVSGTVGGFKLARGGTAGIPYEQWFTEVFGSDASILFAQFGFLSSDQSGSDTSFYVRIVGIIEVSSGGTILLRWAQAVSNATITQMLQGSSLTATRLVP
jgi:hypothetical protein